MTSFDDRAQRYIRRAERHIRFAYGLAIAATVMIVLTAATHRWLLLPINVILFVAQIYQIRQNRRIIAMWRVTR
jgi:hypothetical protein